MTTVGAYDENRRREHRGDENGEGVKKRVILKPYS
jgi:hypothetical protein